MISQLLLEGFVECFLKKVCARFVELCRKMGLLKASVAIDPKET